MKRFDTAKSFSSNDGVELDASGLPSSVRVWRAGRNPTDMGVTLFDEQAALSVMSDFRARGNRISWDYQHASLDKTAPIEARVAAGSCALEVRSDGSLWATDIRWTAKAAAQLRAGEWLSLSPAYDVDPQSGRALRVLNIALCTDPATHNATRLAASRGGNAPCTRLASKEAVIDLLVRKSRSTDPDTAQRARLALREFGRFLDGSPIVPDAPRVRSEGSSLIFPAGARR